MCEDDLRYDRMVEEALRSVVSRALSYAAAHGLPGNHHFYITFRTDHPGVEAPARLRERYPSEMTIVLQHQFWDLEVRDEAFSVTLSFDDVPHHLTVPYEAVVAFADPAVRFGLQFDVGDGEREAADGDEREAERPEVGGPEVGAANGAAADEADSGAEAVSDKVIPLDTFRKKST